MANVIKDINKEKAVRHATHNDVNTEFYLSVMNKQKTNKKMEENLYSRYLEESKKNIERIHSFDDNPHSSPSWIGDTKSMHKPIALDHCPKIRNIKLQN